MKTKRNSIIDWQDWRVAAKRKLPKFVFDFIEGGAGSEYALENNIDIFRRTCITPSVLSKVNTCNTACKLFGTEYQMPIIIAPTGLNGLICPNADELLANAAASFGIPFVLSTAANSSIHAVKEKAGKASWFQLYVINMQMASMVLEDIKSADCPVLVVTVDVPVSARRSRDIRNEFMVRSDSRLEPLRHIFSRPSWAISQLLAGTSLDLPVLKAAAHDRSSRSKLLTRSFGSNIGWNDIDTLRNKWDKPLILKGILSEEDAMKALSIGVDGIVVSNHGGRQLVSAPPPLAVLSKIKDRVGSKLTVMMDGGIRSGDDVAKAIAAGADAISIGRLGLYGLAAKNEQGVKEVLAMLKQELETSLILLGCKTLEDVKKSKVVQLYEPLTYDKAFRILNSKIDNSAESERHGSID